ncbi:SGNH/GDSL hydrolase family protein [Lacticaseibacillus zhaodongensis]|uniref:SGNH/GDSL hydrolase family protein n=1 Tax=Lacticaseibacillus zhaodongensis TaxID=2668065 RepID=UPI0012D2DDE7|nr:SGNH/GDSL hydrolase family protein [Lacticaseibacillus zhaodongensis]
MRIKRVAGIIIAFVFAIALGAGIAAWTMPAAAPLRTGGKGDAEAQINICAVGDSLTHGVGDTTNQGGYVPLIAQDVAINTDAHVNTSNFGVTGDTSLQIAKRVKNDKKLARKLKQADVITLTVGGNDLMHVLQSNLLNMKTKDVTRGINKFQGHLRDLIGDIRNDNPDAPIYVFSIYNPFYVYFPNIKMMQSSVHRWNQQTKKTLSTLNRTHFVDVEDVLSKGSNTAAGAKKDSSKSVNQLIYGKDHFHPNNAGYVQMTAKLWTVMQDSEKEWSK